MAVGEYVSVNDAAKMLGLTVGRIRQLLREAEEGRDGISGVKINKKAWVITIAEVYRYAAETNRSVHALEAA